MKLSADEINRKRGNHMNIGKQIRTYRLQKKVRQEDLAEYLGVTTAAVSKWETEASTPDIALLPNIAAYFGGSI